MAKKKKNKVSNDDDDNKRTYTVGEYLLLAPDLITVKTNPPFNLLHKSDTLLRLTAFRYFFTYRTLVRYVQEALKTDFCPRQVKN